MAKFLLERKIKYRDYHCMDTSGFSDVPWKTLNFSTLDEAYEWAKEKSKEDRVVQVAAFYYAEDGAFVAWNPGVSYAYGKCLQKNR
jgi:hypothetical protein